MRRRATCVWIAPPGSRQGEPPLTRYQISSHVEGSVATIRVEGEFDLAVAEEFQEASRALLEQDGLQALVIDLRELSFMDSSGIAELIRLDNLGRAEGFRLAILRPPAQVAVIFELTGLDQHLPLYDAESALDDEPNRG